MNVVVNTKLMAAQVGMNARKDPLLWAKQIMERVERGDKTVTQIAVDKARKALARGS